MTNNQIKSHRNMLLNGLNEIKLGDYLGLSKPMENTQASNHQLTFYRIIGFKLKTLVFYFILDLFNIYN